MKDQMLAKLLISLKFNTDINGFPINELHHVTSVNQAEVWVFFFVCLHGIRVTVTNGCSGFSNTMKENYHSRKALKP